MTIPAAGTGRADLLRAFHAQGDEALSMMAKRLGYGRAVTFAADADLPDRLSAARQDFSQRPELDESTAKLPLAAIPFWRLESIAYRDLDPSDEAEPRAQAEPIGWEGLGRRQGEAPAAPPIVSDARLWPRLQRALATTLVSRELDVDAYIEHTSRGGLPDRLPYRTLRAWSPRVMLMVDRSLRLLPFWEDQDRVLRMLRALLGRRRIEQVVFYEDEQRPWQWGEERSARPPALAGVPLLVLGDLGCLAGARQRGEWAAIGHRLARRGVRCTALVPCPARRWDFKAMAVWQPVDWARPSAASRRVESENPDLREQRAEDLLTLLAFASNIEPGLLRALRLLLPSSDLGVEGDVWMHPEVYPGLADSADLARPLRTRLQQKFRRLAPRLKTAVVQTMRAWRAGKAKEIWLDEVLAFDSEAELPPGTLSEAEIGAAHLLWRRVAETVDGGGATDEEVVDAVGAFAGRALRDRHPSSLWQNESLRPYLWRAWRATGDAEASTSEGSDRIPPSDSQGRLQRWQVFHYCQSIRFAPALRTVPPGSFLTAVDSVDRVVGGAEPEAVPVPVLLSESTEILLPSAPAVILRTDRTEATLHQVTRPPWASAMGRDRFGLWASFEVKGVSQRLRWIPPGRYWMGSPEDEPGRWDDEGPRHLEVIRRGFWLADTPCTQRLWQVVMGNNPSNFPADDRPVEKISWEDCDSFFKTLHEQNPGLECRFPLEVEWEYACRAGTETATYQGGLTIDEEGRAPEIEKVAWYHHNSGGETHPVAEKPPNPWGLFDMLGNVEEWCQDHWSASYGVPREGAGRVIRGGAWYDFARGVRAAYRRFRLPSLRSGYLGFRLALGQGALKAAEPQAERAEPAGAERPPDAEIPGASTFRDPSRPEAAEK